MIHKLQKLHPLVAVATTSYIYLLSGIIVNFLQLLIFVFIRTFSEHWGTKLNGYLQASHVTMFTFQVEWHSEVNIRLYFDAEDLKFLNKEHVLCICNHRGEVDWLLGYALLERLNGVKGSKAIIKKEVKYLPVVGWFMWFTDFLFLSRNWEQDQATIVKTCNTWAKCDPVGNSNFYVLFAEGTRFTPEKHSSAVRFCKERGVEPFKNVLYPRTKGAVEVISQLGDSLGSVWNVVYGFPNLDNVPSTTTIFEGKSTEVDIYFKRVSAKSLPLNDREKLSEYVVEQFREKDELLEYHRKHGSFPGEAQPLPKRWISLIMYYVWGSVTIIPGWYFVYYLISTECYLMLSFLGVVLLLGGVAANKIINTAVISKASSYGTNKHKQL